MGDVARDAAALELLRVQRARLADRMRLPWWYQTCCALLWALVFAGPFSSRYLSRAVPTWPIVAALALAAEMALLQAALRVTRQELRDGGETA